MARQYSTDDMGGTGPADPEEQDYLSKLANSVLKKQPSNFKPRVAGSERRSASGQPASQTASQSSEYVEPLTPPSSRVAPPPPPSSRLQDSYGPASELGTDGTFAVGTILKFDDTSIAVYKDRKAGKEYEVVYVLQPDGNVKAQGLALVAYDIKVLGKLPAEFLLRLQRRGKWDRDEIIYHLDHFDYCCLIPQQRAAEDSSRMSNIVAKLSVEDAPGKKTLKRGRWITIAFGPQEWSAVFWGEDELGSVVAHNTHQRWALMHLDLNRFKESLVLGELAEQDLLDRIYEDIADR